jgi:hypothetical protein
VQGCLLFQLDVVSLYPSIDITHALEKIYPVLKTWPAFSTEDSEFIFDLLVWVLRNNWVEFNGRTWLQTKGVAMGTPVAVVFSCLYMMCLETDYQTECSTLDKPWPVFFRRFIDDGMGVWTGSRQALEAWLARYNSFFPGIHITWTINDTSIEILDIVFSKGKRFKESGLLDTCTHQKALNRYLYIPWRSYHPRHAKIAFIYGELRRYCLRKSSFTGFKNLRQLFYNRLRARGYPTAFLLHVFQKVSYRDRESILNEARERVNSRGARRAPLVFKTQYNPRVAKVNLGGALKPWNLFEDSRLHRHTKTVIAWKRSANLRNLLVRARCDPR